MYSITIALAVAASSLDALVGFRIGPAPVFALRGDWVLAITVVTWANRNVRSASV